MLTGALVGLGVIAEGHVQGYRAQTSSRIIAGVDPCRERHAWFLDVFPQARVYEDLHDLLAAEEGLHFVDICTPPVYHAPQILDALAAGLHVLCEKPFVLTMDEFFEVLSTAGRTKRVLLPSHNYKYSPAATALEVACTGEAAGTATVSLPRLELRQGHLLTRRMGHAKGQPYWHEDWRIDRRYSGGGILKDHGPHSLYTAFRLSRRAWPTRLRCSFLGDRASSCEFEVSLEMRLGEVEWLLDVTWLSSVRSTKLQISSDNGSIVFEEDEFKVIDAQGAAYQIGLSSGYDDPRHGSWFVQLLEHFCETINGRRSPRDTLEEAAFILAVTRAAELSAETGAVQQVDPPLALGPLLDDYIRELAQ